MYSNICSVVKVNGYQSEPFSFMRSVCRECPLSSLLYVLVLDPLLQRLEKHLRELARGRTVSTYADDVAVIVSNNRHIDLVGTALKEYEAVTGVKVNREKLVGRSSVPGKAEPYRSIVGRWTERPIILLGVWFSLDLQVKNWDEAMDKVGM
ncbi:uncharacterized protein LOC106873687 [Octopus bimaculoides]|uniref:uncharacterized protein LOC106873687 n=1 Tax=Octopus bimaculoides TaxID=37653 RepID=UPI00071CB4B8|nr:uncharacterized protein LOC106873687 [Octopus bimaculoides]|eukprot:XP_014776647.1 PREDICTED: uncharacterized protein LOC106873687 [Octopus bimaculoides]